MPNFIENSIKIITNMEDVTQVLLYDSTIRKKGIHDTKQQGFSFTPGLHRRADLLGLEGGFASFLEKSSDKL